jgi:PKD repeat protein
MFRITTDVNYTMTAPTAFPAKADGTYAEAVWVDLKASCQQCHGLHVSDDIPFIQTADLRDFANGFHGGSPTPEAFAVTITPTKTNLHVDFTATGCPAGKTCDYKWNFGDGASSIILGSAGATTSHNYAAAGNYSAQVIIVNTTDSNNAAKATAFSLTSGNTPPVPAATMTQSGWNVAITNTSTDAQTATSALGVFIQCGYSAGTPSAPVTVSGTGAGPFTCAYTTAGSYVIRMTVTDTAGAKRSINIAASVPVKYSVGGSVMRLDGATPVAGASIRLKLGTQVVKMTTTNALGAYTLQNVLPGSYTVQAVKSGLGFSSTPAAVVTNANLTGINITANR